MVGLGDGAALGTVDGDPVVGQLSHMIGQAADTPPVPQSCDDSRPQNVTGSGCPRHWVRALVGPLVGSTVVGAGVCGAGVGAGVGTPVVGGLFGARVGAVVVGSGVGASEATVGAGDGASDSNAVGVVDGAEWVGLPVSGHESHRTGHMLPKIATVSHSAWLNVPRQNGGSIPS